MYKHFWKQFDSIHKSQTRAYPSLQGNTSKGRKLTTQMSTNIRMDKKAWSISKMEYYITVKEWANYSNLATRGVQLTNVMFKYRSQTERNSQSSFT